MEGGEGSSFLYVLLRRKGVCVWAPNRGIQAITLGLDLRGSPVAFLG